MLCCICKSPEHKAIDCKLSWYQRPASYRDHQDDPPRDRDAPGAPEEMDVSAGSGDPDPPADATSDAQPDAKPATSASPSTPVAEERLLDLQGLFVPQATPADLPQWPPVVVPTPEENSLIGDLTLSDEDEDGDDDADGVKMMALLTRMICLILLMMTTMLMMMTLLMMIWELFPLLILFQLRLVILLETALEARALASAIQRPKLQRKKIGRWPAKLSDLSSVPSRKPTAPTLFAGWKESLAPSRPPDPGNCSADSAPT